MDPPSPLETEAVGLLAAGSSRPWDVSIDETLTGAERWYAQIEGPSLSLYFELPRLGIVREVIAFLEKRTSARNGPPPAARRASTEEMTIGTFGRVPISLIWDDEFADRCFLVVGPRSRSSLRLTLTGDEIRMLLEALRQVREDLPSEESDPESGA